MKPKITFKNHQLSQNKINFHLPWWMQIKSRRVAIKCDPVWRWCGCRYASFSLLLKCKLCSTKSLQRLSIFFIFNLLLTLRVAPLSYTYSHPFTLSLSFALPANLKSVRQKGGKTNPHPCILLWWCTRALRLSNPIKAATNSQIKTKYRIAHTFRFVTIFMFFLLVKFENYEKNKTNEWMTTGRTKRVKNNHVLMEIVSLEYPICTVHSVYSVIVIYIRSLWIFLICPYPICSRTIINTVIPNSPNKISRTHKHTHTPLIKTNATKRIKSLKKRFKQNFKKTK